MSKSDSITIRLNQLSKGKKHATGMIPTKAVERQTLKSVTKFHSDILDHDGKMANITDKAMTNKVQGNAGLIEGKIKMKATEKYRFRCEEKASGDFSTLVDSLVFLLCNLEGFVELASGDDIIEMLQESKGSKPIVDFLNVVKTYCGGKGASIEQLLPLLSSSNPQSAMRELLSTLSASFQASILHDDEQYQGTIGDLAVCLAKHARSVEIDEEASPITSLLLELLNADLKSSAREATDATIKQTMDGLAFESIFARQLFRLVLRDVHSDLLPGNEDDFGDSLVDKFNSLLLTKLKTQSSTACKDIGQEVHIDKVDTTFSRFDFSNTLTVGLLEIGLEMNKCVSRKDFHFMLPNGKRITHKLQNSLVAVNIPTLRGESQSTEDLVYPTVLDAVNQIQGKESFASTDFDWICLNYNMTNKVFEWLARDQPLCRNSQEYSKSSYFVGFAQSSTYDMESLRRSIMVPLSNKSARHVATMRVDNMNLFMNQSLDCTVQDLLNYLNSTLNEQRVIAEDIKVSDIKFESLSESVSVKPTSGNQKIKDLIQKVGWTQAAQENQTCPFICSYKIKHPLPEAEARSAHLVIEETRVHSSQSLKTSLTSFLQLIFKEIISDNLIKAQNSCFLAGQPLEYWLPAILIVDVSKYAASVVNSKSNIDIKQLEQLISSASLSFNTRYTLRGMISSSIDYDAINYYPSIIDTIKSTAMHYYDGCRRSMLDDVNDDHVVYAVFDRLMVDVDKD